MDRLELDLVIIHFPTTSPKFRLLRILKSVNGHCCVANTHALDHKTLNAHVQIKKMISNQDWTNLDKKKILIMKCAKAGLK
jgi:hypothetical protein